MVQKRHSNISLGSLENLEKRYKSPARIANKTDTKQYSFERKNKLMKKKPISKEKDLCKVSVCDKQVECWTKHPKVSSNNDEVFISGRLFDAVLDGNSSIVHHCLLTDEIDVNDYSPEGTTALHLASAAGFVDVLEVLIEFGGFVDSTDVGGRTPLEYAVLYGNFDCATLLIKNGADSKCIKNGFN